MVLGCGKLKTNHHTEPGGQVVRPVGFKGRNGPGRECMLKCGSGDGYGPSCWKNKVMLSLGRGKCNGPGENEPILKRHFDLCFGGQT